MTTKFAAGLITLLVALALQFWFSSAGIFIDLSFAALISFAFLFDLWPLIFFVLLAVFLLNWQPSASPELAIIALVPLVAYLGKNLIQWERWIQNLGTIFLGFLVLYLVAGHGKINIGQFLLDLVCGLLFGALIFSFLHDWDHQHNAI